jgi:CheY-like chemotaxis protein
MAASPRAISVLLVEDNLGDVLMIRRALAGAGVPITIRLALEGKEAAKILTVRHFDLGLVILDLNIPKLSGLAVLERCHIDVPVVVFTSSSDPRSTKLIRARREGLRSETHGSP